MCSLQLPSKHPRDPGIARLRFAPPSCPCGSGGQQTPSEKPPESSWFQQPREASATKPHVEAPSKSYTRAMLELHYTWRCLVHTPNISQVAPELWTFNGMCRLTCVMSDFSSTPKYWEIFSIFATFPRAFQVPNVQETLHSCNTLANRLDFAISGAV